MNVGMSEILVILIVALVVIGPKRLPDVAKSVGKGYGEFKRAFNDMKKSVDLDLDINDKESRKKPAESAYKSRWEEQAAPQAQITGATEETTPHANDENIQEAEITEVPRAKRADLIKEEEDGNREG